MIIIPKVLTVRIQIDPGLPSMRYADEWEMDVGVDEDGKPRCKHLTPWEPNKCFAIEIGDGHDPYVSDLVVIMFNHVEVFHGSIFPQPKAQGFRDPDRVYRPGLVSIDRGNVPGREQRFRMPAEYDPRFTIRVYIWQKKELQLQSSVEGVAPKGPRRRTSLRHSAPREYREVLRATARYKVRSEEWRRDHGYVTADEYEASVEDTPHSPVVQTPTDRVPDAQVPQPIGDSQRQRVTTEPEKGGSDPETPLISTGQAATHPDSRTTPHMGVLASSSSSLRRQGPALQRPSPSVHQASHTQAPVTATPAREPLSLSSETAASLAQHPVWSRKQVDSTGRSAPPQIAAASESLRPPDSAASRLSSSSAGQDSSSGGALSQAGTSASGNSLQLEPVGGTHIPTLDEHTMSDAELVCEHDLAIVSGQQLDYRIRAVQVKITSAHKRQEPASPALRLQRIRLEQDRLRNQISQNRFKHERRKRSTSASLSDDEEEMELAQLALIDQIFEREKQAIRLRAPGGRVEKRALSGDERERRQRVRRGESIDADGHE